MHEMFVQTTISFQATHRGRRNSDAGCNGHPLVPHQHTILLSSSSHRYLACIWTNHRVVTELTAFCNSSTPAHRSRSRECSLSLLCLHSINQFKDSTEESSIAQHKSRMCRMTRLYWCLVGLLGDLSFLAYHHLHAEVLEIHAGACEDVQVIQDLQ